MRETAAVSATTVRETFLVAMSRDAMSPDAMNVCASLSARVTTVLGWTSASANALLATLPPSPLDVTSAAAVRHRELAARRRRELAARHRASAALSASARSETCLEEAARSSAVPSALDSDRPCADAARLVETAERT